MANAVALICACIVIALGIWIFRRSRLVGAGLITAACGLAGAAAGVHSRDQALVLGSVIVLLGGLALLLVGVTRHARAQHTAS